MPKANFITGWFSLALLLFTLTTYAQIPSGYYNDAQSKTGEELKLALNSIIKGHVEFPYTSTSTDTWDILKVADRDPSNSNNVIGIYSGFSMDGPAEYASGSGWSREHVWAQSRGEFGTTRGAGTDCHHLRAEDVSTNSARSNRNFDECTTPYIDGSGTYSGATESFTSSTEFVWKPRAEVKGDVARMLFYMATRYEGENSEPDLELVEELQASDSKAPLHAKLSTLLQWHTEDPVSQAEQDRNDVIYGYQGNRNPFIDHPEYVASIWVEESITPSITVTSTMTNFGIVNFGEVSATQSYTVSGTNLTSDILISSSSGFEISTADIAQDFTTGLTLSQSGGEVALTTIYVRFKPATDSNSAITGVISHSLTGASTEEMNVNGTEYFKVIPEINFSFSQRTIDAAPVYEVQLFADVAPTDNLAISIERTGSTELVYDQDYNITPAMTNDALELEWHAGVLNASFVINSILNTLPAGNLVFTIMPNNDYSIGTNVEFELTIKGPDVINAVIELEESTVKIYPNPTSNTIHLTWDKELFNYAVINSIGKIVISGQAIGSTSVDVSKLTSGRYIFQMTVRDKLITRKIQIF